MGCLVGLGRILIVIINIIFLFSCCGVDSYNDFTGGVKWNTNYGGGLKAPITCCITIPDSGTPTCAETPSDIYTKLVLIIFALIIFCDARQSSKVNPKQ
uniref:Uncharacterized protein n=1 Tax=Magallana gigas TaxID=29159 RepID=A0A8W8LE40_MAGGI